MDLLTSPEDREILLQKPMTHSATTKPTAEKATTHKGGNPKDPSPCGAARTRAGCKLQRGALKRQRVGVTYLNDNKATHGCGLAYHHRVRWAILRSYHIGSTTKG